MSPEPGEQYVLHGDRRSGNCYKVALALHLTGKCWAWNDMDVLSGDTRTPSFLALNPNGKLPTLQFPDGRCLAESNAIVLNLAEETELIPADSWGRARMYQWMFFEQYSHEPFIAVRRFLCAFDHGQPLEAERMTMLLERGNQALSVMNKQLEQEPFFAGPRFSAADIALFAYTHVAGEGGFETRSYPALQAWLDRCQAVEHFRTMQDFIGE